MLWCMRLLCVCNRVLVRDADWSRCRLTCGVPGVVVGKVEYFLVVDFVCLGGFVMGSFDRLSGCASEWLSFRLLEPAEELPSCSSYRTSSPLEPVEETLSFLCYCVTPMNHCLCVGGDAFRWCPRLTAAGAVWPLPRFVRGLC